MIPKTIENTREADETVCRPDDEEVCLDLMVIYLNFEFNSLSRC